MIYAEQFEGARPIDRAGALAGLGRVGNQIAVELLTTRMNLHLPLDMRLPIDCSTPRTYRSMLPPQQVNTLAEKHGDLATLNRRARQVTGSETASRSRPWPSSCPAAALSPIECVVGTSVDIRRR